MLRERLVGHKLRVPRLTVCRYLDETAEEELSTVAAVYGNMADGLTRVVICVMQVSLSKEKHLCIASDLVCMSV